jgi:LPS sulfotransferase NodH
MLDVYPVPDEVLVFANQEAEDSWEAEGRTDMNDALMLHFLLDDARVTCVVAASVVGSRFLWELQEAVVSARSAQHAEPFNRRVA